MVEFYINGHVVLVDDCDADLLRNHKWKFAGGYLRRHLSAQQRRETGRSTQSLHRSILARVLGRDLEFGEFCDHVNGNPRDNRRPNLRPATRSQNAQNSRKRITNISGYKGVSFVSTREKYKAQIKTKGKSISIGYFDTPEAARDAYREAAARLFGEFARYE